MADWAWALLEGDDVVQLATSPMDLQTGDWIAVPVADLRDFSGWLRSVVAEVAGPEYPRPTTVALIEVAQERMRQDERWGVQRLDWPVWLAVLAEEFGELGREVLEFRNAECDVTARTAEQRGERLSRMHAEATQVAAVAAAMMEHIAEEQAAVASVARIGRAVVEEQRAREDAAQAVRCAEVPRRFAINDAVEVIEGADPGYAVGLRGKVLRWECCDGAWLYTVLFGPGREQHGFWRFPESALRADPSTG